MNEYACCLISFLAKKLEFNQSAFKMEGKTLQGRKDI